MHTCATRVYLYVCVFLRLVDEDFKTGSSSIESHVQSSSLSVVLTLKLELSSFLEKLTLIFM